MTLVERQQIAAILGEWELTAALAAEASDKRLKLGRVLKADAILTLSMIDGEAVGRVPDREPVQRHIQAVVCESRFGGACGWSISLITRSSEKPLPPSCAAWSAGCVNSSRRA